MPHLRLSALECLYPLIQLVYLGVFLPQLLVLKLKILDPVANLVCLLLERLILNLQTLNQVKLLLRVRMITCLKAIIAPISCLNDHCAIILLFSALLQHVEPLSQISYRGLVLIVPLLLGQGVELVGTADVHRVVTVRNVCFLQSCSDHMR